VSILALISALAKIVGGLIGMAEKKQLMDAGAAKHARKGLEDALEAITDVATARRDPGKLSAIHEKYKRD